MLFYIMLEPVSELSNLIPLQGKSITITDLYQYDENTNTAITRLSKMLEKNSYNISCHIDRKGPRW